MFLPWYSLLFLIVVRHLVSGVLSASVNVDVRLSQRHALSPYIYGVNFASPNLLKWGVPITRNGGNQCSKYDWKIDMTNSAEDWYFMTDKPSPSFQPPAPPNGSFVDVMMMRAVEANAVLLNPLNVIGFVVKSADKCYSFPVSVYGPQQRENGDMGNGVLRNGTMLTSDWHCFRPYGVADNVEWLSHMEGLVGRTTLQERLWLQTVDNEPDCFNPVHRDAHPMMFGYDELWSVVVSNGALVKQLYPGIQLNGPSWSNFCWWYWVRGDGCGGTDGIDYKQHGSEYTMPWLLRRMEEYFQATGMRLLDTIDLHFYPDGIPSSDSTESDQRAILDGVRGFWDWTYKDPGGIGECGERCMGPSIALLPRMIGELREFAPSMQPRFTVSEYAFGFDDNVYTAALAVAEVLSLLGYWDAYMGARWISPANGTKAEQAFALYLNYDGRGSAVLGDSVNTSSSASPNQTAYSIYGLSLSRLHVLLFNHDLDKVGPSSFSVRVRDAELSGGDNSTTSLVYTMTPTEWQVQARSSVEVYGDRTEAMLTFTVQVTPRSVHLVVIEGVQLASGVEVEHWHPHTGPTLKERHQRLVDAERRDGMLRGVDKTRYSQAGLGQRKRVVSEIHAKQSPPQDTPLAAMSLLSATAVAASNFPECGTPPLEGTPICDTTLPNAQRADWLIGQLSVSEKVSRLQSINPAVMRFGLPSYNWWNEALHGLMNVHGINFTSSGPFSCATSFPQIIGMGATFDRVLVHRMAQVVSDEGRAFSNAGLGGIDFWTPNINVFRDPRWGRGQEVAGEDPYLLSEYAYYLVTGFQQGEDARYVKVAADCKHYAGYDLENWHGHDRSGYDALITNQDLVETYLPSFKACLKDANVASIMCSYNAVNGIPACANEFLMNQVARGRWGWDGWITSDCGALDGVLSAHHYVHNYSELVQVTLRAGMDIGCDNTINRYGAQAVADGSITEGDLDIALTRLTLSLLRLGYFDPPTQQPYRQYGFERVNTSAAHALAHRAALESIVLLKNANRTLPLHEGSFKTIALIGPHGDNRQGQLGNYGGRSCYSSTPLSAFIGLAGVKVLPVRGVDINSSDVSGFDAAVAAAEVADVVVYVGGLNLTLEQEARDRNSIDLPGQQLPLLKRLEAVGKPLIVILFNGGGVDVSYLRDSPHTHAILWGGYPSQAGGDALLDVLLGRYSPAGRLPVTWYPAEYVNQVPMTDQSMRPGPGNPGRTYKFYTGQPVYPFGAGLSYSNFSYQILTAPRPAYYISELIEPALRDERGSLVVLTVNVTNTGAVLSDVVVLAFLSSSLAFESVTPPIKELFDYARVHALSPGVSETIVFGLSARLLATVDEHGHQWLLPGTYTLRIHEDVEAHSFKLLGNAMLLEDFPHPSNPPATPPRPASHGQLRRAELRGG